MSSPTEMEIHEINESAAAALKQVEQFRIKHLLQCHNKVLLGTTHAPGCYLSNLLTTYSAREGYVNYEYYDEEDGEIREHAISIFTSLPIRDFLLKYPKSMAEILRNLPPEHEYDAILRGHKYTWNQKSGCFEPRPWYLNLS